MDTSHLAPFEPIPGIIVFTGEFASRADNEEAIENILAEGYGHTIKPAAYAIHEKWLSACVIARQQSTAVHSADIENVTVLFDGYITDVALPFSGNATALKGASLIARLYSNHGEDFIPALRGSFVALVIDKTKGQAILFNDRQGSRPLFIRSAENNTSCIAPQTRFLANLEPYLSDINQASVGEFLIRGCFYGSDTLFSSVEKIPQATIIKITQEGISQKNYWSLNYTPLLEVSEDELLEELDRALRKATQRLLKTLGNPVLLLSGGLDSRLMLAYLLDEGVQPRCISYAVNESTGNDHLIAGDIAKHCGLQHEIYTICISDFQKAAIKETLASDCRIQMIDAPSDRWEHIGNGNTSMFIGDECFGWKGNARNSEEALNLVGWWNIDMTPRISDWMLPNAIQIISSRISALRKHPSQENKKLDPTDLKDKLYYQERIGNLLNGYSARRLAIAEQARPFLDEDVIAFMEKVPAHLRQDKAIATKLMARKFPHLHALPYATRTSVPWAQQRFINHVTNTPDLYKFIVGNLTTELDSRLAAIFDEKRLGVTVTRLFHGEALPPMRNAWWARLPGMWRFTKKQEGKVGALKGMLRLLQLNLFLRALK